MIDGDEELQEYSDDKAYDWESIDSMKDGNSKDWNTVVSLIEGSIQGVIQEELPKIVKENARAPS